MQSRALTMACLLAVVGLAGYAYQFVSGSKAKPTPTEAAQTAEVPVPIANSIDKPVPKLSEKLALTLNVGDRFPLLKTVQQTLKQPLGDNQWGTTHSRLELLMSVTVEEIRPANKAKKQFGGKRLAVRYHRVRFEQDVPGREVQYDSENPPTRVPLAVWGYHRLKDNGFQFWLDESNQIVDVVGYDLFLKRCLDGVPVEQQQEAQISIAATSGTEGVANFIDNSIGVLPADAVREGDKWENKKQLLQPVPMWVETQYMVRSLTRDAAEIEMLGTVRPGNRFLAGNVRKPGAAGTTGADQPAASIFLEVVSGHSVGHCEIDRRVGLPVRSRVEQSLDMNVHLPGGDSFPQQKTTVTTIEYFPTGHDQQSESALEIGPAPRQAQQPTIGGRL